MKSVVVIDSVSRAAGGLFDAERRLHQSLAAQSGVLPDVFALEDAFSSADASAWNPIRPCTFPTLGPRSVGFSPTLRARLIESEADLLYRAGLWSLPSRFATAWSKRYRKPEVIAPHGMLDPWAVMNSAWKKRIAHWLYEGDHLRNAACIRALCESEAQSIRAYDLKNPIAIIPNGIDLPEDGGRRTEDGKQEAKQGTSNIEWKRDRKVLLYLGRIHPKKGLINLLRAWNATINSQPSTNDWQLAIAGWDQGGHEAELKCLAAELGILWIDVREPQTSKIHQPTSDEASIIFLGPQFGEDKAACYRNCDAFILPSFSEGLPMVVLEAWAYGKPVLMTDECNLPEGFTANAAIHIETGVASIVRGLQELFDMPDSMRVARGACGHDLVATRFSWPKIARQMRDVYQWVVGGGSKPESVSFK